MMKDVFGVVIEVGDTVAYARKTGRAAVSITKEKVHSLTEKMVRLDRVDRFDINRRITVNPFSLVVLLPPLMARHDGEHTR